MLSATFRLKSKASAAQFTFKLCHLMHSHDSMHPMILAGSVMMDVSPSATRLDDFVLHDAIFDLLNLTGAAHRLCITSCFG